MIRNRPSPEGRQLGAALAALVEPHITLQIEGGVVLDQRCATCAFRLGTLPNGCASTQIDALTCVWTDEPFYCHHGLKDRNHPKRLCYGWIAGRTAVAKFLGDAEIAADEVAAQSINASRWYLSSLQRRTPSKLRTHPLRMPINGAQIPMTPPISFTEGPMFHVTIPLVDVPEGKPFDARRFIVKIQIPIGGFMDMALIYNEDRQVEVNVEPITDDLRNLFGPKEVKIFRWASLRKGQLEIGESAPWQKW